MDSNGSKSLNVSVSAARWFNSFKVLVQDGPNCQTVGWLRCSQAEESVEHFIFDCPFSELVWRGSNLGFNFDMGVPVRVAEYG